MEPHHLIWFSSGQATIFGTRIHRNIRYEEVLIDKIVIFFNRSRPDKMDLKKKRGAFSLTFSEGVLECWDGVWNFCMTSWPKLWVRPGSLLRV